MPTITPGRTTSDAPDGTVVFSIGIRVNRPLKPHEWIPVFRQIPQMLAELRNRPNWAYWAYWAPPPTSADPMDDCPVASNPARGLGIS